MQVHPRSIPPPNKTLLTPAAHALHNLAHIELNAIDLAWDTVVRFSSASEELDHQFFADFAHVADDESRHFLWCLQRLAELGFRYNLQICYVKAGLVKALKMSICICFQHCIVGKLEKYLKCTNLSWYVFGSAMVISRHIIFCWEIAKEHQEAWWLGWLLYPWCRYISSLFWLCAGFVGRPHDQRKLVSCHPLQKAF